MTVRRGWQLGERITMMGFGLLVAGAGLEAGVLLLVGEVPKFPRHVVGAPWGLRYNQPGAEYRHKSADGVWFFRINQQGMRADREYAYEKPAGVKRIVSLGDSFTIGFEVSVEETFSSVLEQALIDRGIAVEVLNTGVSGFSSAEEYLYLKRELVKYQPDLVLISFWFNDHGDNVRSGLFRSVEGQLVPWSPEYVPLGSLANALNRNWLAGLLSERSNGFVFVKRSIAGIVKKARVRRNAPQAMNASTGAETDRGPMVQVRDDRRALTAAIYEVLHQLVRELGVPLVIQSIPTPYGEQYDDLIDEFPVDLFDVKRPGITYVSGKRLLDPYAGSEVLYWQRSQFHWTPFSHRQAGMALANVISEKSLLQ